MINICSSAMDTQHSPSPTVLPHSMISDLYLGSSASKAPLRVGLLLDTPELNRAFASVLRDITSSNFAKLELVVLNAAAQPPKVLPTRPSLPVRLWRLLRQSQTRATLLWALYNRLDQRLWRVENDPLQTEDCSRMLDGVELIEVEPISSGFIHRFPEEAVAAIRSKTLDVILRFGFNIIRGGILRTAKYGVWSFHHGDNDYYRGGPAHFWEMYEENALSGVILQVLSDELDAGRVLAKALFPTETDISLTRNRVQPYWGSTHMVIQKLWELHEYGWEFVEKRALPPAPYCGRKKIYRRPTNLEMAGWFLPQGAKKLYRRAVRSITRSGEVVHWRMAIRSGGRYIRSATGAADLAGFQWIESPKGHFYADPFVFERAGQHFLFFEDYDYRQERGVIACAEVSPDGQLGPSQTVLDCGVHVSYPYIFSEGDTTYMIPETGGADVVRLYQCVRFPDQWSPVAALFHGPALDTSVWKQDGLWWFFTTLKDPRGHGITLYLFFSETLGGKWQYHPANPISQDVRKARCAGRLFVKDGRLIRPSQDSSRCYGYAFALNDIVKLSPTDYEEHTLLSVEPHQFAGLRGVHTYGRAGSIETIDGHTLRPRTGI